MLTSIIIFSCLVFSIVHPLCFWLLRHPIDAGFRKFNLFLIDITCGIALFGLLQTDFPRVIKTTIMLWAVLVFFVSARAWQRNIPTLMLSLPSALGLPIIYLAQVELLKVIAPLWLVLLGSMVLCLSIFTLILGHWYLNVSGLSISHIMNLSYFFWMVLGLRTVVDIFLFATSKILHGGDFIYLYQFILRSDGFLLIIPLFFGTLLPLFLLYFVIETLKVKSTQSATGILYVVSISVLMGDLAYKYFLLKFGIAL